MARFLLPLMRGMADAGHDVVGICADGKELSTVRDAGLRVITVPFTRSMAPHHTTRALWRLIKVLRRERFDMIHVHTPVAAAIARAAAVIVGVPRVVYTAHGFYFHDNMALSKRAAFVAIEWLAGRATHTLFTQSAEDAATALRLHLCRTNDVQAIGNGSDPARYCPDPVARDTIRAGFSVPHDRTVIISVGRLVTEKGFPELITAMRDVDAELWIVGARLPSDHASAMDDTFNMVMADPQLRTRVRLLGHRNDVPALLAAADVFTLASHREGMPRSIIEAMLTGLPVVATNIRGSREEVCHNETGLLVPVADPAALAAALDTLATDANLRHRLGAAGLQRARRHYDEAAVIAHQLSHLSLSPHPDDCR